ncbi:hypothetical protein CSKR_200231 [Clonorchis sinensis]|uniref:Uncharacterized protein n=1 Tax=Clonorchis sinensis TaxID=79923 RepID=A0A8T1M0L9_CLOSI|nr:hypothetical protein CSKR_200231 [Clonorchis sinensis]
MLTIYFVLILLGPIEEALSRSIPTHDLCIEACGDDPHEDNILETFEVEVCRDQCDKEEKERCLAKHKGNEAEEKECWQQAYLHCMLRCGDLKSCVETCRDLHTPPGQ